MFVYFLTGALLVAILASADPILAWSMLGGMLAMLLSRINELKQLLEKLGLDMEALRNLRRFGRAPSEVGAPTGFEVPAARNAPEPPPITPVYAPAPSRPIPATPIPAPTPPPLPMRAPAPVPVPIRATFQLEPEVPAMPLDNAAPALPSNDWTASAANPQPDYRQPPPAELPPWLQALLSFENWPIKLGVLLLLIGLGSGFRYLEENGYLNVPIEARLLGIAVFSLAVLAFGWSKRESKRSFALSMQGGALGALLLTCYAGFRLYHVIPPQLAFPLMLIVVMGGVLLAVLQDAMWLAFFAALGGFAAPILASTGQGSHVQLFSYYLLLNGGVLAIALYKGWRPLNLLGAIATFGIGLSWGFKFYRPEFFHSVEPFLIAFFLIYVAITVAYTLRHGKGGAVLDGILVFGVPLAAFGSQAGLLADDPELLGISSFLVALLYAALAWGLRKRESAELLQRCFVLLAASFFTLAIPLYFRASWTSALWAIEGAGVLWLGLRQQRWLPQLLGLALQVLAGFSYLAGYQSASADPVLLNGRCFGALLLSVGALLCCLLLERAGSRGRSFLLFALGLFWWTIAGLVEIGAHAPEGYEFALFIAWAGLTQLLASLLRDGLNWPRMAWPAQLMIAALPLMVIIAQAQDGTLLAQGRGPAFGFYLVATLFGMNLLREPWAPRLASCHTLWLFGVTLGISLQSHDLLPPLAGDGLQSAALAWPFLALLAALQTRMDGIAWPLHREFAGWRDTLTSFLSVVAALALLLSCSQRGDATPLTFIPLFNPLEAVQLACFALLYLRVRELSPEMQDGLRLPLLGLAFVLITTLALRLTLHWFEPNSSALLGVAVTRNGQAALSIVWSMLGCGAMLLGHARSRRQVWISGAVLMALVLFKMLLIDRRHLSDLAGIVAMLGVGGLLAAVGYFAPAPPAQED